MKERDSKKKTILAVMAVAALSLAGCTQKFWNEYNAQHPGGNAEYWNMLKPTGAIEKHYMQLGPNQVESCEASAPGTLGKFEAWYPAKMAAGKTYPVIISNNGTGTGASKYTQWFRHMASWGFIVVGNEEGTSWNGNSAEQSLVWALKQNAQKGSPLFGHVDKDRVATIGHSQGGTGVVNCATVQPHAKYYKTAVMLASTHDGYNIFLRWKSDASLLRVPTLILVAKDDGLTKPEDLSKLYNAIPASVFHCQGRRIGCGHGDMLVIADGYVTAWMMWQLQGDGYAAKAFTGQNPELQTNSNFVDVKTSRS